MRIPNYLKNYKYLLEEKPKNAALEWFKQARYGLFIHYGLYSQLGENEHVWRLQDFTRIEYEKMKDSFNPEKFDADYYVKFAIDCGMRYINMVTKHCDGFSLWDSKVTDFTSVNSPSRRDLVKEMAEACEKYGMGLFLFYEHGMDWRHPHGPAHWDWKDPRVKTVDRLSGNDPWYASGEKYDINKYVKFVEQQITELLSNYGPVAGIWLDGIGTPLSGDYRLFKCRELYALIRKLQPQALISYKQGLLGTEDFFAPEHRIPGAAQGDPASLVGKIETEKEKIIEICTSMTPTGWSYIREYDGQHKNADEVWETLDKAGRVNANLLLNIGPLPDGSIHHEDETALRAVGERLRQKDIVLTTC